MEPERSQSTVNVRVNWTQLLPQLTPQLLRALQKLELAKCSDLVVRVGCCPEGVYIRLKADSSPVSQQERIPADMVGMDLPLPKIDETKKKEKASEDIVEDDKRDKKKKKKKREKDEDDEKKRKKKRKKDEKRLTDSDSSSRKKEKAHIKMTTMETQKSEPTQPKAHSPVGHSVSLAPTAQVNSVYMSPPEVLNQATKEVPEKPRSPPGRSVSLAPKPQLSSTYILLPPAAPAGAPIQPPKAASPTRQSPSIVPKTETSIYVTPKTSPIQPAKAPQARSECALPKKVSEVKVQKSASLIERMKSIGFSKKATDKIEEKKSERKKRSDGKSHKSETKNQKKVDKATTSARSTEKRSEKSKEKDESLRREINEKVCEDKGVYCNLDGDNANPAMLSSVTFFPYRLKKNMQIKCIQFGKSALNAR